MIRIEFSEVSSPSVRIFAACSALVDVTVPADVPGLDRRIRKFLEDRAPAGIDWLVRVEVDPRVEQRERRYPMSERTNEVDALVNERMKWVDRDIEELTEAIRNKEEVLAKTRRSLERLRVERAKLIDFLATPVRKPRTSPGDLERVEGVEDDVGGDS